MNDLDESQAIQEKQSQHIEKNIRINHDSLRKEKIAKAQAKLKRFLYLNIFSLVLGVIMVFFGISFSQENANNIHMLLSGGVFTLWSSLICYGAISQIKLYLAIDYSAPIPELQHRIHELRLSALHYIKLSLMIIPFHMAFMVMFGKIVMDIDLIAVSNQAWLHGQLTLATAFLVLAAYLYRSLSAKNIDKPIVKLFMKGFGNQAEDAAREIDEIKNLEE